MVRATIAHLRGRDIEDFALDRKSAAEREIIVERVEPTQLQQHSPCSRATYAMQQCNAAWRNIVRYMNATLYDVYMYVYGGTGRPLTDYAQRIGATCWAAGRQRCGRERCMPHFMLHATGCPFHVARLACNLHAVCCLLHVACCLLHVARALGRSRWRRRAAAVRHYTIGCLLKAETLGEYSAALHSTRLVCGSHCHVVRTSRTGALREYWLVAHRRVGVVRVLC